MDVPCSSAGEKGCATGYPIQFIYTVLYGGISGEHLGLLDFA
jgi:hypothetical protein